MRPRVSTVHRLLLLALGLCLVPNARAEDSFYRVPLRELRLTEGKLPQTKPSGDDTTRAFRSGSAMEFQPRAVVEGGGGGTPAADAYVASSDGSGGFGWTPPIEQLSLFVRAPQGRDVSGRLFLPNPDGKGITAVRFSIPASAANADAKQPFYRAKSAHYAGLINRNLPGGAWFRHQLRQAIEASGQDRRTTDFIGRGMRGELDDTYTLFTGGRAVSENLQLDRVLPAATQPTDGSGNTPVKVDSIKGITVREMDWAPLIKDARPQVDPLASKIPVDQHAAFFPSVQSLAAVIALAEQHGTPALQSLQPQAESAELRERYERQLAHSVSDLVALAEAGLIKSVAITGYDPYLRVGSDLAIVMESPRPQELAKRLNDQVGSAGSKSPDRTVSASVEILGSDAVLLTNSPAQVKCFQDVRGKATPALSTAPEYTFFRQRYVRGGDDEAGFLVLTDATIRRWCGPRMRIADSRRTRAAAVMAELQALHLQDFVGQQPNTPITNDLAHIDLGEVRLTPAGVHSSTYNTLAFMTPISEMQITEVTKAEAQAYERWRDGYQRNWSWAFDPIALRLSLPKDGKQIAADLTVMPLIDASRYRQMIEISRGAAIKAGAGDPHDGTLAHIAFATNPESAPMKAWSHMLISFVPQLKVNPLDWLGQTVAVYFDEDPFWAEARAAQEKEELLMRNVGRLPVALYAQVRQPLKLAAFLTALRGFIEQSAPNLTQWQSPQHNGRTYVKITANVGGMLGEDDAPPIQVCYATSPDSFILTLNEELLKRAIDRQIAREAATSRPAGGAAAAPATVNATTRPADRQWLGANLALDVDRRFIDVMRLGDEESDPQAFMRRLAWGNIPILNEWMRLYPDRDPVDVHEQAWHVRLIDPAGGKYVWNEQWQTMESTTYGHAGTPKEGPATPQALGAFQRARFGIDFEPQGIRARAVLLEAESKER